MLILPSAKIVPLPPTLMTGVSFLMSIEVTIFEGLPIASPWRKQQL
jgi:hypothetical protein